MEQAFQFLKDMAECLLISFLENQCFYVMDTGFYGGYFLLSLSQKGCQPAQPPGIPCFLF